MTLKLADRSRPGIGGSSIIEDEFEQGDCREYFDIPERTQPLNLPEIPEVEIVRYFTELSLASHGVDNGCYPLGSCTMKYNPKRNDKYADLDGFRHVHPLQPFSTMQGVLELLYELQKLIAELTGMDKVALQPAAGAHGEFAGILIIKKFFQSNNEKRNKILVADSAHGTNPATATMAGFETAIVPTSCSGQLDLASLHAMMNEDVAALMLTNPSTLGLFEHHISEIAQCVHEKGGLLYYDGANLNALMGIVRPGDMGFDVMHINTHKTLSTPHGGGGPGAGPVGVKAFLQDYLPYPWVVKNTQDQYQLVDECPQSIGRIKAFMGHVGVLIKAYSYILAMGAKGLRQASEDAVLNANYLQHQLRDILPPVFNKTCMHECLLSTKLLPTSAYNFAKRLIDHGIHPPTLMGAGCVYFPEALGQAMLLEPTETETKENLDYIVSIFRKTYHESHADAEFVNMAPHRARVKKVPEQALIFEE